MLAGRTSGKMARRKMKKRGGSRSKKMPLTILAPALYPAVDGLKAMAGGDIAQGAKILVWRYGGVDDSGFNLGRVTQTYVPVLAGVIVHKAANKFGVNRYLPKWLPVNI